MMATYTVTVERVMRDTFDIEAEDETEAIELADAEFCELHGEHEYDHTETTIESVTDDEDED
jgi:hypothetical protein